jgi:hypothetical protein
MTRTSTGVVLLSLLLTTAGADLDACGDKSLSAGGIRMQRALAARYPASILFYAPASSRLEAATHELGLPAVLPQVGHKSRNISTLAELEAAAAAGQYNVVLTDLADVADLQRRLDAVKPGVVVIRVAYQMTKQETAAAAKQAKFVIKAPGHITNALTTIADAVRSSNTVRRKA